MKVNVTVECIYRWGAERLVMCSMGKHVGLTKCWRHLIPILFQTHCCFSGNVRCGACRIFWWYIYCSIFSTEKMDWEWGQLFTFTDTLTEWCWAGGITSSLFCVLPLHNYIHSTLLTPSSSLFRTYCHSLFHHALGLFTTTFLQHTYDAIPIFRLSAKSEHSLHLSSNTFWAYSPPFLFQYILGMISL
jgi:hypothetical protein